MTNQQQRYYIPQMQSIADAINAKPRLVQCIQCHNEEEFIGATLRSIYDQVDQIICVEGAVKNRPNSTEDGHSTDHTVEIIEDFKENHDPGNKLLFIQIKKPFENLEELKQTFLDLVMPGDWIIINDADEFYRPEDIRRLRVAIDLNPHAMEFVPLFLHFYRDFQHVAVPGPEWQPQHQRVFRNVAGMKYVAHPVATLPNGECSYFSPLLQNRRVMLDDFFVFHYGYARKDMDRVMTEKKAYYEGELAKHGAANVKFDQKVTDWFAGTEPLLEYLGPHPTAIHSHPMYRDPDEILGAAYGDTESGISRMHNAGWSAHELYSKALKGEAYGNIWLCMNGMAHPAMPFYHNGMSVTID